MASQETVIRQVEQTAVYLFIYFYLFIYLFTVYSFITIVPRHWLIKQLVNNYLYYNQRVGMWKEATVLSST
jgi:hypothetical protein